MERRKLVKELTSNLLAFVFIYALFAFLHEFTAVETPWNFLWTIVPFYALTIVRKYVNRFSIFLLIHLAYVGLPLFLTWGSHYAISVTGLFVGFAIYSLAKNAGNNMPGNLQTAFGLVALFAVLAFLISFLPDVGTETSLAMSAFLTLMGLAAVLFYVQMENMDSELRLLEGKYNFSQKGLFKASYIIMSVFMVIIVGFGIAAALLPEETINSWMAGIGLGIMQIFGFAIYPIALLASFFFPQNQDFGLDPEVFIEEYIPLDHSMFANAYEQEIWEAARDNIAGFLNNMAIFGLVVLGIVVIVGIYIVYRIMSGRPPWKRKRRAGTDVETEKIEINFKDLKSLFASKRDKHSKHPTRRAYRKKVNSHIKNGVNIRLHHNTENIGDMIRKEEDIDDLTHQYEVVRYGRP
ncbi:MAG: DUF3488 domain-containing protein [Defluviitaleaceae bacterium]|nr:DUF3488 domain-containing protein [Defluviitaleaceae bacterium]